MSAVVLVVLLLPDMTDFFSALKPYKRRGDAKMPAAEDFGAFFRD